MFVHSAIGVRTAVWKDLDGLLTKFTMHETSIKYIQKSHKITARDETLKLNRIKQEEEIKTLFLHLKQKNYVFGSLCTA